MKKETLAKAKLDNLADEQPSAVERAAENIKELGKAINNIGVKTSDNLHEMYERNLMDDPKPIGYLEHEPTKTRICVFESINWFRRLMMRWCFGIKYIKKD